MLQLEGVTRTFDDVTALADLTLAVDAGEVVGLLGHNGAGKTTTVRLLAGLLAPDVGTVRVDGLDPVVDGPEVRRRIGVLPATAVIDDRLTATQNLRFAADTFGVPTEGLDARIADALRAFSLEDRGHERVGGFSTGMRQRLSLARVLLPEPGILLLDEPTAALDPMAARQVRRVLADLARDRRRTVVLCTHDLAEAEQLCDRVVVLERGRTIAAGSPAELVAAHGTGGVQVEVAPEDIDDARRHLAEVLPPGHAPEVDGPGRLRATGVARQDMPRLIAALGALTVYEVRRLEPTLADVYLALHGGPSENGERP